MTLSPSSQPFKDDIDLKQELRSDTLDTRQDYELKVNNPLFKSHKVLGFLFHKMHQILFLEYIIYILFIHYILKHHNALFHQVWERTVYNNFLIIV